MSSEPEPDAPPKDEPELKLVDRRRTTRVPMPPTGGVVSVVGARLLDVCPYGMMIQSPVPMGQDHVLQFRLIVEGVKADVQARVASCRPIDPSRKSFGVGLEFVQIAPETRERLREVLAAHAASAETGASSAAR